MKITDLYQTKITLNTYNLEVTETNNVQVTVELISFNKTPISNRSVTVTCSQGYFTSAKDSTSNATQTWSASTNKKEVTLTTPSDGKVTLTWEHGNTTGLTTFTCNEATTQVLVTAQEKVQWTEVTYANTGANYPNSDVGLTVKQYVNGHGVGMIKISGKPSKPLNNDNASSGGKAILKIGQYKPVPTGTLLGAPLYHSGWNITGTNGGKMICFIDNEAYVRVKMVEGAFNCNGNNGVTGNIFYRYDP